MKNIFIILSMLNLLALNTNLHSQTTAKVQIIHNSADILASSADIYINAGPTDPPFIPDFAFRSATPFLNLPAGVLLNIGIAPGNSASVNDTLKNFQALLTPGETYVVIANGVTTEGYKPNPDGRNTSITLFVKSSARETALGADVDFFTLHGSTDAPTVDIKVRDLGSATIIDDAAYGDITSYLSAPAQEITLDLYLQNGIDYVASFVAPLSGFGGRSAVVFASGFLDPADNKNGEPIALLAAFADGSVVEFPPTNGPSARVQIVHNSADISADTVDLYINAGITDPPAIPDFAFRSATPFLELPAGVKLNIGIAPGNSSSVSDTLKNFPFVLSADEKYIVFANGLLTSGYASNPNGRNTDFTLLVKSQAREIGAGSDVDLFVLHGSTDAPTVDTKAREAGNLELVNDASYRDITSYFSVPAADYTIDIYLSDGITLVDSFIAPLNGFGGKTAAVFASGFLDPAANQNGSDFGLFAALADGTVIELVEGAVPVELSSFIASVNGSTVTLDWQTESEINNKGFYIERKIEGSFEVIGFTAGNGTTTDRNFYRFVDSQLKTGFYTYRLKQVDFDGSFEYSKLVKAEIVIPNEFSLSQNFPNPFNPSTTISFNIPIESKVSMKLFNALGKEVMQILNENLTAGSYSYPVSLEKFSSGVYFYIIEADGINGKLFKSSKKMTLIK